MANAFNLLGLHDDLKQARKRQKTQQAMQTETEAGFKYASENHLPATANALAAKLRRTNATLAITNELVKELEKAVGTLPLDKK